MFNKITNLISITTISILLSCIFSSNIYAQTELFGFGGYQVASDVQTSEGDLNIYSNPNYGAGIDFEIERGTQLELLWIGQKTFAELQPYAGGTIPLFNVFIHYFQGGILYEFRRTRAQRRSHLCLSVWVQQFFIPKKVILKTNGDSQLPSESAVNFIYPIMSG